MVKVWIWPRPWPRPSMLSVRVSVHRTGRPAGVLQCRVFLIEAAPGGTAALAQAHRRNVARLAGEMGEQLLAMQQGKEGICPPEQAVAGQPAPTAKSAASHS